MSEKEPFKRSFILHKDALDVLDELTIEQSGELFLAIRDYQQGIENELSPLIKIVFAPFKAQFIRDSGKYEKVREARRAAGRKGGEAKKANLAKGSNCQQDLPKVAKLAVSDSDSVIESDSGSEIVSGSDSEKDVKQEMDDAFKLFWFAGMKKSDKAKAEVKFKKLAGKNPMQFAEKLAADIKARLSNQQMGFDKMMPTTYLNNARWEDELTQEQPRSQMSQKADFSFNQPNQQIEKVINQPPQQLITKEDFNL